jgi:hypothetical protein|tara:strand:- start:5340 stop:5666 length:327 start_codon:yes stop_codon:yes gene_type:complete
MSSDPPLIEALVGLIASVGAYLSWKAKSEASKANKEASEANRAVNGNPDGSPRLYEMVGTIKERQRGIDITVTDLRDTQKTQGEDLRNHSEELRRHSKSLDQLCKEDC